MSLLFEIPKPMAIANGSTPPNLPGTVNCRRELELGPDPIEPTPGPAE